MKQCQQLLKQKGIRQSMPRRGNCLDNSCPENFFWKIKNRPLLYKRKGLL